MDITKYYERVIRGKISFKDILDLWNEGDTYDLLYLAYSVKRYYRGNPRKIDLCSIVNARSGRCPENCIFCSQSIYHNTSVKTYGLKPKEEILKYAKYMENYCSRFSIVVSGRSIEDRDFERIVDTVRELKERTKLNICVSLGILERDKLKELKELGVRIHNNLETSQEYFEQVCTTHSYEEKIRTIRYAKKLGLEVCSGGIFGLGESYIDRIKMLKELKDLNVDSVALNILHPIRGTKIYTLIEKGAIKEITPEEALKSIALSKIILPDREIRLCGGRLYKLRDLQCLSLLAVDGLMVGNYLTTQGRSLEDDIRMIRDMGFTC
ncbi:MAG TPA: biotin synthase BioB [Methanothermococcus okinawensis]|uniref:Biotin synthase n=1 Tax=Methanothermococcus okinawensis TaxID=155863 RepID=A0A832ZKD0_9EURY|nr:biotin synthase BioB [Methanococcaceae archaeon]HIP84160.1 biotin synthase BioB [Methanothermococcus okinawensis]HIP91799.1 biotin synthase BioB [Methanothermococcus okinawensis]